MSKKNEIKSVQIHDPEYADYLRELKEVSSETDQALRGARLRQVYEKFGVIKPSPELDMVKRNQKIKENHTHFIGQ